MIYYHVFGTFKSRSRSATDVTQFWRTEVPISWDKNPDLIVYNTGASEGLGNLQSSAWGVQSKYGQQVNLWSIAEERYNSDFTGVNLGNGNVFDRGSQFAFIQGSVAGFFWWAYDVEVTKIVEITNPAHKPANPFINSLVSPPLFPLLPDIDFGVEIKFDNKENVNLGNAEQRIIGWSDPIRTFSLSRSALKEEDLDTLLAFQGEVGGVVKDFLYKDLSDCQATRNPKDLGDGVTTRGVLYPDADGNRREFIFTKQYSCAGNIHYRPILFPINSTVQIYRDNTLLSGYVIAPDRVLFDSAPAAGLLTWSGEFYTLCHFEETAIDHSPIARVGGESNPKTMAEAPNITLRESRIEPSIFPVDVLNLDTDHSFRIDLYKRCTLREDYNAEIVELSSGGRARFPRSQTPVSTGDLQQKRTLIQKEIEYLQAIWLAFKGSGCTFLLPDRVKAGTVRSRFASPALNYSNQTHKLIYQLGELRVRGFTEGILNDVGAGGFLASPILTLCRCVRIELTDGSELGYTSASRDLQIGRLTYRSRLALDPSNIDRELDTESDNQELSGAFSDNLKEELIFSSRFREARITVAIVDWLNPPNTLEDLPEEALHIGIIGEITSRSGEQYTLENLTENASLLNRARVVKTSPSCRHTFGDSNCRVIPTVTESSIALVRSRRQFQIFSVLPNGADFGTIEFLEGLNKGAVYPVFRSENIPSAGQSLIELYTSTIDAVRVHDRVRVTNGCARTFEACKAYNNSIRFGNVPSSGNWMPGNDFMLRSPRT